MRARYVAIGLALAAAGLAVPASAQDQWEQQARASLQTWAERVGKDDYSESHGVQTGSLGQGETGSVTFRLEGGRSYKLIGGCDDDCTDLDFALIGPAGNQLDSDYEDDAFPIVKVSPEQSGSYQVRVTMVTCNSSPCRYATQGFATASGAQDAWVLQVRRLLQEVGGVIERNGMTASHAPFIGELDQDGHESWTFDLEAGRSYAIAGVCDNDCSDLDLELYDPGGALLVSDTLTDDVPLLRFTSPRQGTYGVRAKMVTCTSEPCRYGIGVFQN